MNGEEVYDIPLVAQQVTRWRSTENNQETGEIEEGTTVFFAHRPPSPKAPPEWQRARLASGRVIEVHPLDFDFGE